MAVGRNDACPCGSGKKYKQCCQQTDDARRRNMQLVGRSPTTATDAGDSRGALAGALRELTRDAVWEIDAIPLPVHISEQALGRPCVLMVMAGGLVLSAESVAEPPSEPDDVAHLYARTLMSSIAAAASTAGATVAWPRILLVRHATVARALAPLLATHDVDVQVAHLLPDLDDAARQMRATIVGEHMAELDGPSREEFPDALPGLTLLSPTE